MVSRIVDWLDAQSPPRRRLYGALLVIPFLTVPCYVTGVLLLIVGAPPEGVAGAPTGATPTVERTVTLTTAPIRRETPVDIGRLATPTELASPTEPPPALPTETATATATDEPLPTPTDEPTAVIIRLDTPTPVPSDTVAPEPEAPETPTAVFVVLTPVTP